MHDRKQFIGGTGVYIKGVSGTGLCIKGVTVYSADVDMRELQIVMCSLGRIGVEPSLLFIFFQRSHLV